jgi:hypothetical protein
LLAELDLVGGGTAEIKTQFKELLDTFQNIIKRQTAKNVFCLFQSALN